MHRIQNISDLLDNFFWPTPSLREQMFDVFDYLPRQAIKYPPYNIVKFHDDSGHLDAFEIQVALAGFSKEEISVDARERDGVQVLWIKGRSLKDEEDERGKTTYHHQGLSKKTVRVAVHYREIDTRRTPAELCSRTEC